MAGILIAISTFAFYPFHLDPPRMALNRVTYNADGSLGFQVPSRAVAHSPVAWLQRASAGGELVVDLELRPAADAQFGPSRILAVSGGLSDINLVVAQYGTSLVVRLRNPDGSAANPLDFDIRDVLEVGRWERLRVAIGNNRLEVRTEGRPILLAKLPPDALRGWKADFRLALGDDARGGRPWSGDIRRATVQVRGEQVDYLATGLLTVPERLLYIPGRLTDASERSNFGTRTIVFHTLSFFALGIAVAGGRRSGLVRALVICAGVALVIQGAKVLFAGRHPSAADLGLQTLSGQLAVLAVRAAGELRKRFSRSP
ncbi:MAG: hypothetical protein ACT4OM_07230 [Actinomycetota bacterium]